MAIPPLENETQEFDPFFPLSQEMKQSLETENDPKGQDWNAITILQEDIREKDEEIRAKDEEIGEKDEEIREKDEEIKNLNGIIKSIVGVIPKKFYG